MFMQDHILICATFTLKDSWKYGEFHYVNVNFPLRDPWFKIPSQASDDFISVTYFNVCINYTILTLCSRLIRPSLYSWLPSIIPVKGLANHSLNSLCDWNTWGIRKCIKDHNSIRLFCNGVPVSNRRLWLEKFSNVCHLWDLKFLMFWAWKSNTQHCRSIQI